MKLKKHYLFYLLGITVIFYAMRAEITYEQALADAKIAQQSEVKKLTKITKDNPILVWDKDKSHVLMTSYVPEGVIQKFYIDEATKGLKKSIEAPPYDAEGFPRMWVSPVPEMKKFVESLNPEKRKDAQYVKKKIIQFLGLHPKMINDGVNRLIVEMWIRPEDMFRPCIDTEITDDYCNVDEATNQTEINATNAMIPVAYAQAYMARKAKVYNGDWAFPWTRLGYTYNWGSDTGDVQGASELVVKPGSTVYLDRVVNPVDYPSTGYTGFAQKVHK